MAHGTPGRPRAGEHVDRRAQILEAAEALVAEGGLGAASVRAVAARAGIGPSTMRYWFPSQDALATAVAEQLLTRNLDDHRIADTSVPARERLLECLEQFLGDGADPAVALQHALRWFVLMENAIGPDATDLGTAMVKRLADTANERLRAWLRQLAGEGALDTDRVDFAATVLWSRIDGLSIGLLSPGGIADLDQAMDVLRHDVAALVRE